MHHHPSYSAGTRSRDNSTHPAWYSNDVLLQSQTFPGFLPSVVLTGPEPPFPEDVEPCTLQRSSLPFLEIQLQVHRLSTTCPATEFAHLARHRYRGRQEPHPSQRGGSHSLRGRERKPTPAARQHAPHRPTPLLHNTTGFALLTLNMNRILISCCTCFSPAALLQFGLGETVRNGYHCFLPNGCR